MHGHIGVLPHWEPASDAAARRRPVIVASARSYLRRNTIFLVQQRGYDVSAVDGAQALYREARIHRPALILLDATLPDATGFEACRELRAQPETSGIPVLMFSLNPTATFHDQAVEVGAIALMRFPGQAEELVMKIDYALAGLPTEGQAVRITVEGDMRTMGGVVSGIEGVRSLQVVPSRESEDPSSYMYRHATVRFEFEDRDFSQVAWQATVHRVGTRSADLQLVRFMHRQPRRKAVRKDVPLAVELLHPNGLATVARVLNLSVAGMLVANLPWAVRVGDLHDFRLDLGKVRLDLRGVVRRAQEIPNFGHSAGIAFVGLAQEARDALIDYLFCRGG